MKSYFLKIFWTIMPKSAIKPSATLRPPSPNTEIMTNNACKFSTTLKYIAADAEEYELNQIQQSIETRLRLLALKKSKNYVVGQHGHVVNYKPKYICDRTGTIISIDNEKKQFKIRLDEPVQSGVKFYGKQTIYVPFVSFIVDVDLA